MTSQDYYKILGISQDADKEQIRTAYRDLAFKFHPDRNQGSSNAAEKMKQVNEAYAVLSDPGKRQDYDAMQQQYGSANAYSHFRQHYSDQDIFRDTDIYKVFDEFARSFGFRNFNDISKEFYGKNNAFKFKKSNINGVFFFGAFNIGRSPFKFNSPGKIGEVLKTLLQNFSGPQLPVKGKDLYDTIIIDPNLAQEGGPYAYYHKWASKKLMVKIPPNVRHGQQIRLKGMGEQGTGRTGDLLIKIETRSSLIGKLKKFLPF